MNPTLLTAPTPMRKMAGLHHVLPSSNLARGDASRSNDVVQMNSSTNNRHVVAYEDASLEQELFDRLVEVKILTSKMSMRLSREWRDLFFEKLDRLHDVRDWEEGDTAVQTESVKTYLRALVSWMPHKAPALALSTKSNILAMWRRDSLRLTVEFYPYDIFTWVVSGGHADGIDDARGKSYITKLASILAPYEQFGWFEFADPRLLHSR